MKRFTYWPQFFLGITFNYGIILGWVSINGGLNLAPVILYIGAIFWTLGYDTIYGFQDIKDDEIIGLKSTSIKFKKKPSLFLISCYLITITCLLVIGTIMKFNFIFYTFLITPFSPINVSYLFGRLLIKSCANESLATSFISSSEAFKLA